jgi:hypothetical protein
MTAKSTGSRSTAATGSADDTEHGIIHVPNSLATKVGSYKPNEALLKKIEADVGEFGQNYPEMVGPELGRLNALWGDLKKGTAAAGADKEFYRIAHDFKGQGSLMRYPLVSAIAASLCSLLERDAIATPAAHGAIEAHVSAIGAVLQQRIQGDGGKVGKEVVEGLRRTTEKVTAKIPPARSSE